MATIDEFKIKAKAIEESLKAELSGIRTNRPSTALFDALKVNYYDQMTPLRQLGTVSVSPPREIVIQVWDQGAVAGVAKAIETSGLGLTANTEGNVIRIFLPELSSERRAELIKFIKSVAEKHRIQVRHARDEANKEIQRQLDDKEMGEDQKFTLKEMVQKETDRTNDGIEKALDAKVKEIME